MKEVIIFENLTNCLMAESAIKEEGIGGRIIPTPPHIRRSCGMAYLFDHEDKDAIKKLLEDQKITYEIHPFNKK